jgi:hypothetical protein
VNVSYFLKKGVTENDLILALGGGFWVDNLGVYHSTGNNPVRNFRIEEYSSGRRLNLVIDGDRKTVEEKIMSLVKYNP